MRLEILYWKGFVIIINFYSYLQLLDLLIGSALKGTVRKISSSSYTNENLTILEIFGNFQIEN